MKFIPEYSKNNPIFPSTIKAIEGNLTVDLEIGDISYGTNTMNKESFNEELAASYRDFLLGLGITDLNPVLDIEKWNEERVKTNEIAKRSGSLRDAISTLIRFNVDCRNVASIDDEQADKARELFESIKGFI